MHYTTHASSSSAAAACRGDESLKTERNLMPSSVIQSRSLVSASLGDSKEFNFVSQTANLTSWLKKLASTAFAC